MTKLKTILISIAIGILIYPVFFVSATEPVTSPLDNDQLPPTKLILPVPYINESPDNSWTGPWKNGCEEASVAMIDKFYQGKNKTTIKEAKTFMSMLFDKQNKLWQSNANSDAARTTRIINDYSIYNGKIIDNPTIKQIKNELRNNRPVISPHFGFDLKNKNIPFLPPPRGSSYHMMAIIGYDDSTGEFIVNDTGDSKTGEKHRYKYELFMNTLHDYNYQTKQADGAPRVIFTYPKLVKLAGDPKVYLLTGETRQWIVDAKTFNAKKFNWGAINTVEEEWLMGFKEGANISVN